MSLFCVLTLFTPSFARTCKWCVVSASPVGFADVTARGPVWSIRFNVMVLSGMRTAILSGFPMYFSAKSIPRDSNQGPEKLVMYYINLTILQWSVNFDKPIEYSLCVHVVWSKLTVFSTRHWRRPCLHIVISTIIVHLKSWWWTP